MEPVLEPSVPGEILLRASNLRAEYEAASGGIVAVDDVSLSIRDGEVLGVAGESGCGKSTLGAVLSLTARPPLYVLGGELEIAGRKLSFDPDHAPPRLWRGSVVSLLPQGAMNSISPTIRIGDFAVDIIRAHEPGVSRKEAIDRAAERLEQLGLPARALSSYPHQLSGGMKQRVVTVLSTLLNPRLLIADEPTSALDVSTQKVMIELLIELLDRRLVGSVIFVTHDLPVLRMIAHRIAIMYAGRIAEIGETEEIINRARHPYTGALLASVLVPEPQIRRRRITGISGAPPSLADPPPGCRFHPRCNLATDVCRTTQPPQVGDWHQYAACWWAQDHQGEAVVSYL
ncbi:MAG: ABC transporter ATP-binding protein [Dactylosporangium sp.]|nr:ABC transporter ATP-binding protein [Dactylosporangium sp.]NNJ60657.1 ABC transporter ATP-binding protein [Dactylosporangium sp.]